MTEDVMATYAAHQKALAETMSINKTVVLAALAKAAITTVSVTFDGGGDSGQIDEVFAEKDGAPVEIPHTQIEFQGVEWSGKLSAPAKCTLRDAIEALCFNYLSHAHGGWENNDGGQGDFTFHVQEQRIELDFNQFYTESTNHSHTF